jgi:hypothetical protein
MDIYHFLPPNPFTINMRVASMGSIARIVTLGARDGSTTLPYRHRPPSPPRIGRRHRRAPSSSLRYEPKSVYEVRRCMQLMD